MQVLERSLRNKLEKTIKEARDVAEDAARAALEQLGVGESVVYKHLNEDQRQLRRKLRVHGRQIGDTLNGGKVQTIDRLIEEVAYEHWHRMLFARFLAENNLLMYPDPDDPVAVSLEECEDLAVEEGLKNGWELASRFAARMLPQIFRPESPVFLLELPPEYQQKLEWFLAEVPGEVFHTSDSLGWVYQFWQAKKKDEVNASEVKIGSRELPAVTQLFTEPYMVAFLLDNSIGAWWAAQRLTEADFRNANTEEELRHKASLPGMPLDYLRFVKQENGAWIPAAGVFGGWPKKLSEFKMLDPCCGSGHFLVVAFMMLTAMRMEDEALSILEATDAVLRDNLYGLEIDRRCTEIAAFNLALAAWRMTGFRPLTPLHIACTGLSIGGSREQWMDILAGQSVVSNLRFYFGQLYDLFSKAPTLGSLINPHRFLGSGLLDDKGMENLHRALATALAVELKYVTERSEMGIIAQGVTKAAELLADRYSLVATNVPYLGRGKQDEVLQDHLQTHYPLGKADLAIAFVLRCLEFCAKGGATSLVTPQSWLFLDTYKNLREMLLENRSWNTVARLGSGSFETISGQVVNVALSIISAISPNKDSILAGINVSISKEPEEKAAMLRGNKPAEIMLVKQEEQLKNPASAIVFEILPSGKRIGDMAYVGYGTKPGQTARVTRQFWEFGFIDPKQWTLMASTPDRTADYTGRSKVCLSISEIERQGINEFGIRGAEAWGKTGVIYSKMSDLPSAIYNGEFFDDNTNVIIPNNPEDVVSFYVYVKSGQFNKDLRLVNQKLNVTRKLVAQFPFNLSHWQKVAAAKYPNGLPEPESNDPTQWLFHGYPKHSTEPLQVAVARLLGYRWPAELDDTMRLSQRARDLVKRSDELLTFADKDGIVCIPPVCGEASAADRLLDLLAKAYGKDWHAGVLNALLKEAGYEGKYLETWLRDGFFVQHCNIFRQHPFIWQIWDGLRDGFSALVNYHKLGRRNLETLIYTYLGDWIKRQQDDRKAGVDGAQERLAAADVLKKRLELILDGEDPYDIFVRWKPLHKQPLGWEPDLNDGVRMNIRPLMTVPDVKVKGAGVLRVKPKIKWTKDRGKEPERPVGDYPWFWGWNGNVDFTGGPEFTGERFNDCHYTLNFKRQARQKAADKEGVSS
jgi:hypothetical protein